MNTFNSAYFEELIAARRKKTIRNRILMAAAALIVFVTSYVLILPAITMSHETFCGQEHEHIQQCYSDPTADLETVEDWEAALPTDLNGTASENLQRVAESQLGYTESIKNYQIVDGVQRGYTRYGAWSGQPYDDWGHLFIMFCKEYAGITDGYTTTADEYPMPGDLLLINGAETGIVTEVDDENDSLTAIEGDSMDQVRYVTYELTDSRITGYGLIAERNEEIPLEDTAISDESPAEPSTEVEEPVEETPVSEENSAEIESSEEQQETAGAAVPDEISIESDKTNESEELAVAGEEPESAAKPETETGAEPAASADLKPLSYKDKNIAIQVEPPENVQIPETATLQVAKIEPSDKDYVEDASLVALTADKMVLEQNQYSMSLVDEGQLVELNEPLQVSMVYSPQTTDEKLESQALIMEVSEDESNVLHRTAVENEEVIAATFNAGRTATYNVMLLADATGMPAGNYGKYNLSYNEVKDVFVKDSAYDIYYNENSPLGTAGSFHLVGFDTVTLGTHTNGNVLAKNLIASSNFGTNLYPYELTYAQNYQSVNSGSASMTTDHILVIGSNNTVTLGHNRDEFYINGTKLDRPYNLVQDVDTAVNPFIDLERVKIEIQGISARLAAVETTGVTVDFTDENNRSITLNDPTGSGFYTVNAKDLQAIPNFSDRKIKMKGFEPDKTGSIIINVDCTGVTKFIMPDATIYIGDEEQSTNETTNFSNGKVIWNFINAEGVTIETKRMTGMVIAPGANVDITQNLNGNVVADNIHVKAESHRTDFTGEIEIPGEEKPSGLYLRVRKVDSDNISIYLNNAKFDLYKWDQSRNQYILEQEGLSYEDGKALILRDLEYNRAYRLVEVTAPAEYKISDVPYDFIISHANTTKYPVYKPSDSGNHEIEAGHTIFFKNEKMHELVIKKIWTDSDGQPKTVEQTEIIIDVWRNTYADESHTELIGSSEYETDMAITAESDWTLSLSQLPRTGTKYINGVQTKTYYTYFVKEQQSEDYHVIYDGNGGMVGGVITITNVEKEKYLIPETGGPGLYLSTIAGMLFITIGALLLVIYRLRRREVSD